MQRILLALVVAPFFFPGLLSAGSVKEWHLTDVEKAPVLIVGRVDTVRKDFQVPRDITPWSAETWAMLSQVKVIRSYSLYRDDLKPGSPKLAQPWNTR